MSHFIKSQIIVGAVIFIALMNLRSESSDVPIITTNTVALPRMSSVDGSTNKVTVNGVDTPLPATATLSHIGWDNPAPATQPSMPAGTNQVNTASSATPHDGDIVSLLQGAWRGKIDEKNEYKDQTSYPCISSIMADHVDLILTFGSGEFIDTHSDARHSFVGTGTLKFDTPIVTAHCPDPGSQIQFIPNTDSASVMVHGHIEEATNEIHFNWTGVPPNAFQVKLGHQESGLTYQEMNPMFRSINIKGVSVGNFSLGYDLATEPTTSEPGGTIHLVGEFSRQGARPSNGPLMGGSSSPIPTTPTTPISKGQIAAALAALAAYLALLIPGIILNPQSSDFASLFGTLIGSLEALQGLGLGALASQAKLGGFLGGAIAESFELAQIYQASEAAGESGATTAERLGISAVGDIVAFVASAAITQAAIGVAMTATPILGAVGAGVVAVGGAALITYGISSAATAAKTWATGILNASLGK